MGAGAGIYWFFNGFKELKSKRIIQNIPTSKINTGAVGTNVEIKGRIISEAGKLKTAPISGIPCVIYSLEIQKLKRNKNSSSWIKIDQFYSDKAFYVDDKSGATALVYLDGAKISRKGELKKYRIHSRQFSTMPSRLKESLNNNIKKLKKFKYFNDPSWYHYGEYRFREWCFKAGEELYVLGHAQSGLKQLKRKKIKFNTFLRAKKLIEKNPELQSKYDTNKDGSLDPIELEHGAKILAKDLSEKYSPKKLEELLPKTKLIFKRLKGQPFHISNMREEELVKQLTFISTLKIWGGPALAIACSIYLFFTFS